MLGRCSGKGAGIAADGGDVVEVGAADAEFRADGSRGGVTKAGEVTSGWDLSLKYTIASCHININ